METVLIFDQGIELPHFAAFVLLDDPAGLAALRSYYEEFVGIAAQHRVRIVIDTPTWRANPTGASGSGTPRRCLQTSTGAAST